MGNAMTKALLGKNSYEYLKNGGAEGARARKVNSPYIFNHHDFPGMAPLHPMRIFIGNPAISETEGQTWSPEEFVAEFGPGPSPRPLSREEKAKWEAVEMVRGGVPEEVERGKRFLMGVGSCELGFMWRHEPATGGWRCVGGEHYMSFEEWNAYHGLESGKGDGEVPDDGNPEK